MLIIQTTLSSLQNIHLYKQHLLPFTLMTPLPLPSNLSPHVDCIDMRRVSLLFFVKKSTRYCFSKVIKGLLR
jgi:hypothetical protein